MTVRIGDSVPANRRRDDERPAEAVETRRRVLSLHTLRRQRLAWPGHFDSAVQKSRT